MRNIVLGAVAIASGAAFAAWQESPKRAPELDGGHGWINTDKPVTMASLKGKIVLLDFWTYC